MTDKTTTLPTPRPRAAIASPDLTRPNWTTGERRDPNMLWLDRNENTDPKLARVVAGIVAEVAPDVFHGYPESGPLYRKLAAYLGVGPENLLLSAGSDGAIRSVFEAYIDPGDVVVHSHPSFAMYAVYARMYGADARPVQYRPSNNGPALDAGTLIEAIGESRPRLVCLPNPDSPTGTVFCPAELRAIVEAAADAGAVMLIDEAYYPFYSETALPWINDYPHLVVTRSTGKAWGLAGFRIGYAACSPELATILHKVRPMYETNALAVAVFERMLDHEDEVMASVRRLQEGKSAFLEAMNEMGFRTLGGHGNFLHVAFGAKAGAIHEALRDLVYYRKDFNLPCLQGFSRFTSTTVEKFQPVIERIVAAK